MSQVLRLQGHDTLQIIADFKLDDLPPQSTRKKKYDQLKEFRKYCIPTKPSPWDASKQPKKPGIKHNLIDFMKLASTWDHGSRRVRESILHEFIHACKYKTAPQLEIELSNGASLFLTRITSWMRLTYLLNYNLSLQIEAIKIFTSASGGKQFLTEFIEVGGVLTLIEIITQAQIKEKDKAMALRLLIFISSAGRRYKEFICECQGVRAAIECLSSSKIELSHDYARHFLQELGTGNPKYLMQVYKSLLSLLTSSNSIVAQLTAGQALRGILPNVSNVHVSIVEATVAMLKSPQLQLQQEGYEVLRALIGRAALQDAIIVSLSEILQIVVEDSDEDTSNRKNAKAKAVKDSIVSNDQTSQHRFAFYMQQCYAVRLLGKMVALSPDLVDKMLQSGVVFGLLLMISNVKHVESQKYASDVLYFLTQKSGDVVEMLKEHLGLTFYDFFSSKPDTFYKELTKEQIRYLKRNALRLRRSTRGSTRRDEEMPMVPSTSFAAANTEETIDHALKEYEKEEAEKIAHENRSTLESVKVDGAGTEVKNENVSSSPKPQGRRESSALNTSLAPDAMKNLKPPPSPPHDENQVYLPLTALTPQGLLSSSHMHPTENKGDGNSEYLTTLKKLQQTPIGPVKQTEIGFPSTEPLVAYKERSFAKELRARFNVGEEEIHSLMVGLSTGDDIDGGDIEEGADELVVEASSVEAASIYQAIIDDLKEETGPKYNRK